MDFPPQSHVCHNKWSNYTKWSEAREKIPNHARVFYKTKTSIAISQFCFIIPLSGSSVSSELLPINTTIIIPLAMVDDDYAREKIIIVQRHMRMHV